MEQMKVETNVRVYKSLELVDSFDDVAASRVQKEAMRRMGSDAVGFFSTLENKESAKSVEGSSTWDSLADCGRHEVADRSATCGWIDDMEVYNVSLLLSELEQAE
ncbi:unnamed protein product [Peronospora effusa]|nr:unnamed protein product [Peronospora effusa]